jgi:hypothetical protein
MSERYNPDARRRRRLEFAAGLLLFGLVVGPQIVDDYTKIKEQLSSQSSDERKVEVCRAILAIGRDPEGRKLYVADPIIGSNGSPYLDGAFEDTIIQPTFYDLTSGQEISKAAHCGPEKIINKEEIALDRHTPIQTETPMPPLCEDEHNLFKFRKTGEANHRIEYPQTMSNQTAAEILTNLSTAYWRNCNQ